MSTVVVTNARYAPFWTQQLGEAVVARNAAANARPFDLIPWLLAVEHVTAVARIIASLEGES
jgi:hypothetical protein